MSVCRCLVAAVAILSAAPAFACNVPVFRYALERWQNDLYHLVVFHKGPLSTDDAHRVDELSKRASLQGGGANFEVTTIDLDQPLEPGVDELKSSLPDGMALPCVVLQARMGREKVLTVWQEPLASLKAGRLTSSPDRREIADRLLKGHSAVWVVLPGTDELATHNTVNLIETELNRLQDELPLPAGIGQPGSEVYSEIPLTLRFSVLVLKPGTDADILLPEIFRRIAPEAAKAGQPLVAPVFGRGRAVDVIPGNKVDEAAVEDLSRFICGACSCQVKEQNPGFDLLMTVPWNERLFAPDVRPPEPNPKNQHRSVETVAIAAGAPSTSAAATNPDSPPKAASAAQQRSPTGSATRSPASETPVEMNWTLAYVLAVLAITLGFGWAFRRR
jgi:hypothetical protein